MLRHGALCVMRHQGPCAVHPLQHSVPQNTQLPVQDILPVEKRQSRGTPTPELQAGLLQARGAE